MHHIAEPGHRETPMSLRRPTGPTRRANWRGTAAVIGWAAALGLAGVLLAGATAHADVAPDGSFTTNVPITVPAYHGVEPALALTYSSNGPNGWIGEGWRLSGTSAIVRESGHHGLPSWTADDHFAVDGVNLIACAGSTARVAASPSCARPANGTVAYTSEIETYSRIGFTPDTIGGTWTVWRTNGVVETYWPVTHATQGVLEWRVGTVTDLSGNTVRYNWTTPSDSAQPELASITYGDVLITFKTEDRPDPITSADGDGLLIMADRLSVIEEKLTDSSSGKSELRSYRLTYATHDARTRQSFLASVKQYGSDGTTSYPATTYDTDPGHDSSHWTVGGGVSLPDVGSSWPAGPADANRWNQNLGAAAQGGINWPASGDSVNWLTADVNQDGRQDIVHIRPTGKTLDVLVDFNSDGGGYLAADGQLTFPWPTDPNSEPWLTLEQQTINDIAAAKIRVGDVNADGYPDLVVTVHESDRTLTAVALNSAAQGWSVPFAASQAAFTTAWADYVADVTGDGRADLIESRASDPACGSVAPSLTTFVGVGDGSFQPGPTSCFSDERNRRFPALDAVDLNNDLKTDFAAYIPADTGTQTGDAASAHILTALSTGNGSFATRDFVTTKTWTAQRLLGVANNCHGYPPPGQLCAAQVFASQPGVWGDFDGDGRTDLAVFTEATTTPCPAVNAGTLVAHVFTSNGDGDFTDGGELPTSIPSETLRERDGLTKKEIPLSPCGAPHTGDNATPQIQQFAAEMLAANLNGDALTDIAVASKTNSMQYSGLDRVVNMGERGFASAGATTLGWGVTNCTLYSNCRRPQITVGDSNSDGDDDITVIGGAIGGAATAATAISPSGFRPSGLLAGDVNGDGRTDQVSVAMSTDATVQVRVELASGGSYTPVAPVEVSVADVGLVHIPAQGWRLADITGDHRADLINLPSSARYGIVLIAGLDGGWTEQRIALTALDQTVTVPGKSVTKIVCERRDDRPGLYCHAVTTTGPSTTTTKPAFLPHVGGWQIADVTGDGVSDLIHVGPGPWSTPGIATLTWSSAGGIQAQWTDPTDADLASALANPLGWHLADVNGDGLADLVEVDTEKGRIDTLVRTGDTWRHAQQSLSVVDTSGGCRTATAPCGPSSLLGEDTGGDDSAWTATDTNADGKQDLVRVILGQFVEELVSSGKGTWRTQPPVDLSSGENAIAPLAHADSENWGVADVDLDGRVDLVHVSTRTGDLQIDTLLSDGAGKWARRHSPVSAVGAAATTWAVDSVDGKLTLSRLRRTATGFELKRVISDAAPDAISSVANGLGVRTTLNYTTGMAFAESGGPANCSIPVGAVPFVVVNLTTGVMEPALTPNASPPVTSPPSMQRLLVPVTKGADRVSPASVAAASANITITDTTGIRYGCPQYSTALRSFTGWEDTWTTHAQAIDRLTGAVGRPASVDHVTRSIDNRSGISQIVGDETTDANGIVLARATSAYEAIGDAAPYVDLVARTDNGTCTGGSCADTSTKVTHDADGNVTIESDTASGSGLTRTIDTDYLVDDELWLHNQPRLTRTYDTTANKNALVAATAICYDGDTVPDCNPAMVVETRGLVSSIHQYDSTADKWVATHTFTYDHFGNQIRDTDAKEHPSTITYDQSGLHAVSVCNAVGQCVLTPDWDLVAGKPTKTVAITGGITTAGFDQLGRLDRTVGPTGIVTTFTYTSSDQGTQTTATTSAGRLGRTTTTLVDGLGHTVRTLTPGSGGKIVEVDTAYLDATLPAIATHPYFVGDPITGWDESRYDELRRPTATVHSDGSQTSTSYSEMDGYRYVFTADEVGNSPAVDQIDGWGNHVRVSQPSMHPGGDAAVTYTYDVLGHQTSISDPAGNTETLAWNSLGEQTTDNDPNRGDSTFTYDPAGNVAAATDARNITTTYVYDQLNRKVQSTDSVSHHTNSWSYDFGGGANSGHLTSESDASAAKCNTAQSHSWTYNLLGETLTSSQCTDGLTAKTTTRYDALGDPETITYPDGLVVTNTYDSAGNLTGISNFVSGITYTAAGSPRQVSNANHTTTINSYDPNRGWVTRQDTTNTTNHAGVFDETYAYDPSGAIAGVASRSNKQDLAYTYNVVDELVATSDSSTGKTIESFTYDDLGNISTSTSVGNYAYSAVRVCAATGCAGPDAVTQAGRHSYTYDTVGNTTSDREGKTTTSYTWTPDEMLSTISDGSHNILTNVYDADNARVAEKHGTSETIYVGQLATHDSTGWTDYIYDGASLVATQHKKTQQWYALDHQQSPRTVTDAQGGVVRRTNYNSYGLAESVVGSRGYTDAQTVGSTGLIYLNARDYDPRAGRMLSADSITPGTTALRINRYAYAFDNPVAYTDPSGHAGEEDPEQARRDEYWTNHLINLGLGASLYVIPSVPASRSSAPTASNDPASAPPVQTPSAPPASDPIGGTPQQTNSQPASNSGSPPSTDSGGVASTVGTSATDTYGLRVSNPPIEINEGNVHVDDLIDDFVDYFKPGLILEALPFAQMEVSIYEGLVLTRASAEGSVGSGALERASAVPVTASTAMGGGADNVANGARLAQQLSTESAESVFTSSGNLSQGAIDGSRSIIPGVDLNAGLAKRLTADGTSIADWSKYSTSTYRSPAGDFQVHFYMNRVTGAINYSNDYKVVFNGGPR